MSANDLLVVNAKVTTLDRQSPAAGAILIRDGRFLIVGNEAAARAAAPDANVIDAKNRRVIPGLIDSHTHIIRGGLNYNMELRWDGVPSLSARQGLGLEAAGYGALLGCLGAGAVAGAVLLKRLRKKATANALSVAATGVFALSTLAFAVATNAWIAALVLFTAGLGWIGMLTALNVAAHMAAPGWVKARALAMYLLVFQGAMTGGSILWGTLATGTTVTTALVAAAVGQGAALLLTLRWRLPANFPIDLVPSHHWAEPVVSVQPAEDRGPVAIEIVYRVDPARLVDFVAALRRFRSVRQRDGAIRWDVWEHVAEPGRVVESFVVESWIEHQRQHERVTRADQLYQETLRAFLLKDHPPVVRHLLRPL